jgi:hypothetical protein
VCEPRGGGGGGGGEGGGGGVIAAAPNVDRDCIKMARNAAALNNEQTYIFIQSMPVITKVVQATFSYPTALRVFKDLPQKLPISNFIRQTTPFVQSAAIKSSR